MGFLPIIPALIALYIGVRRSTWHSYLDVYIPVLFLLPMYYRWILPLFPDPTFEQATIVATTTLFVLRGRWREWRFSFLDVMVAAFAGCIGYSEYLNAGYDEAQNLMFDMLASFVLPYVLTKSFIAESAEHSVALARRIVALLLAVSIISVYEFRMGVTPWLLLFRHIYPNQGLEWVTTFRYGFARIAGPYGHAILAGLVLAVGFRLQRWLEWSEGWEPHFRLLGWTQISKARWITLGLLGGIVMTMVRGPWLGGIAGATVAAIGRTKQRARTLVFVVGGVLAVAIPAGVMFYSYASVGRAHAKTPSQETAAYRMELLDKYLVLAAKGGYWGYGRNTWPRVQGAPSIDNYYLLLALMHGQVALALFVGISVVTFIRLLKMDLKLPLSYPLGSSLGFTLAGIYVLYLVTLATVYMGLQTIPLFALITGWSEGYLVSNPAPVVQQEFTVEEYSFERVVA